MLHAWELIFGSYTHCLAAVSQCSYSYPWTSNHIADLLFILEKHMWGITSCQQSFEKLHSQWHGINYQGKKCFVLVPRICLLSSQLKEWREAHSGGYSVHFTKQFWSETSYAPHTQYRSCEKFTESGTGKHTLEIANQFGSKVFMRKGKNDFLHLHPEHPYKEKWLL